MENEMGILENINAMIETLEAAKADADKHDAGVKAAGPRIRKTMQIVKAQAQVVRDTIISKGA
jgi:hypothetical protein